METIIKSMTGVSIASVYFANVTSLELFPKHQSPSKNNRIALLYGKNGSGKSTIAQGFREYRDSVEPRSVTLTPMEGASYIRISPGEKPEKIFVYDEEYISSRIKIKDSGLDAIVLFGEQVDIEKQIAEVQEQIKTKKNDVLQQETEYTKFVSNSDINAPDYWLTRIRGRLREANGWAEIGSRIKGQRQNLSVTDTEIERIGGISPTKPLVDLQNELTSRFEQFMSVGASSSPINKEIMTITLTNDICDLTKQLLKKVIKKPQLSEREQKLLSHFGIPIVTSARTFLSDSRNAVCDKCFQPISEEYRDKVLNEIECILNRDVEEFKNEIEKLLILEISIDTYQGYHDLPSFNDVRDHLDDYNRAVSNHNAAVQAKIDNLFEARTYEEATSVIDACAALNLALIRLESDRVSFNRIINERNSVKRELLNLNDAIAYYSIAGFYKSLILQRIAKNTAAEQLQKTKEDLDRIELKKIQLDSKRKNYHIAEDEINKSLEYIFFCNGRLSIELGSDQVYHLKVNGNPINPKKVSCGERNALALSYYFTEITKDMDARAVYSDEVLLVIDDPVSSFDLEIRIGILSFLRWKFEQVIYGCPTTKILIMTHDISVVFDMEKALSEISKHCEIVSSNAEYCLFQLDNKCLSDFKYKKHNEYTQLLQRIYQYATSATVDSDSDLVIGNVMRRVLEAFASFSFKKGVEDVSLDERVLRLLSDEKSITYYRNLMYRLVLNNESHSMENIQGAPEMSFFSHLSSVEKQRTAKDILCFIFRLNQTHMLSHLPDAENDLRDWCVRLIGDAVTA
jgi:GTPase SAR1 family protein